MEAATLSKGSGRNNNTQEDRFMSMRRSRSNPPRGTPIPGQSTKPTAHTKHSKPTEPTTSTEEHIRHRKHLERTERETEERVRDKEKQQRSSIITKSEHLLGAGAEPKLTERIDEMLSPSIRAAVESDFIDTLEEYEEYGIEQPPQLLLDNYHCELNQKYTREALSGLAQGVGTTNVSPVLEDQSEKLGTLMNKLSAVGLDWKKLSKAWKAKLPKTEAEIFRLFLHGMAPSDIKAAIKTELGQDWSVQDITVIIRSLRISLAEYLHAKYVAKLLRKQRQRRTP